MAISKSPLTRSATIRGRRRRGNVLALTAIFMVPLMAMIALAVDIGYLCHVQAELQRAADSAALADRFRFQRLSSYPGAMWLKTENVPIYAQEHMEQLRQFTSIITLTFRLAR